MLIGNVYMCCTVLENFLNKRKSFKQFSSVFDSLNFTLMNLLIKNDTADILIFQFLHAVIQ